MYSQEIKNRFRGFLPVVVDIETGGFDCLRDAVLEVAAIVLDFDAKQRLYSKEQLHYHVQPFPGAQLDPDSMKINGINPYHPLRIAYDEKRMVDMLFGRLREILQECDCKRAILVGHNASFDLNFINALAKRTGIESPFHSFSSLDTVTLGALAYGQTVLAKVAAAAEFTYDKKKAHAALYDAQLTADIFCKIVNDWDEYNKLHPHTESL